MDSENKPTAAELEAQIAQAKADGKDQAEIDALQAQLDALNAPPPAE